MARKNGPGAFRHEGNGRSHVTSQVESIGSGRRWPIKARFRFGQSVPVQCYDFRPAAMGPGQPS